MTASTRTSRFRLEGNALGAFWLACNGLVFSIQINLVKLISDTVSMSVVALFMAGLQGVFVGAMLLKSGERIFVPGRRHLAHFSRAALMMAALFAGITSVKYLPVAEATALSFCKPLFVTALGAMVLKEAVGPRRVVAVLLGFAGVLVLARPEGAGLAPLGVILGLGGAFGVALATIATRILAQRDRVSVLMFYQTAAGIVIFLPMALLTGARPEPRELGILLLIGTLSIIGNLLNILAVKHAEASHIAPVDFLRAVFAGAIAYLAFGELPTPTALVGTGIILAGALLAIRSGRSA